MRRKDNRRDVLKISKILVNIMRHGAILLAEEGCFRNTRDLGKIMGRGAAK